MTDDIRLVGFGLPTTEGNVPPTKNYEHYLLGRRVICLTKNTEKVAFKLCQELFFQMSWIRGKVVFMRRPPSISIQKTWSRGDTSEVVVACRFSIEVN
jgi:hypothetical protein